MKMSKVYTPSQKVELVKMMYTRHIDNNTSCLSNATGVHYASK
jgi:hypothetical protein